MRLSDDEISIELQAMRGWMREGNKIKKTFAFGNFMQGLAFVNAIAAEAEKMNHHPDVILKYKDVTFILTTHSEGGLTEKDFAFAKRVDEISSR